jgi:hypothetical protein
MNIIEMIKEGLRIARTSKSLWLYGFFVGLGATASSGGHGHAPAGPTAAHLLPHGLTAGTALLATAVLVLIAACGFMYFVSQGALIEGVTRLRGGKPPGAHDGWRSGLSHWGVLFRIAVIYFVLTGVSVAALAAPLLLALKFSGTALAVMLALPAVLIAVPWLVTLYMWREFAARIAVLESRHAFDAIGKARLFLHGRLLEGLKLIVAAFLGRLIVVVLGAIGLAAVAAIAVAVLMALGMAHATIPVVALGALVLLPIVFVLVAVSGTTQSSIWTIGYLRQEGK